MKKLILCAITMASLGACTTYVPVPVETRRTVIREERRDYTPRKASPSVSSAAPEEFRAVERPSTYSE